MPRANTLLALLAAIMLVIAGAPARASATPCDPCPPDCAMMQQMAASMDHHGKTPDPGGLPDNRCKQGLACPASFAAPVLPQFPAAVVLTADIAEHAPFDPLAAPSRPPDRSLRPPIQL
jgi:hypothetical protein